MSAPIHSIKVNVLEERVNNMQTQNSNDHERILAEIAKINEKLDGTYVTQSEFAPVKAIAYSLISLTSVAVLGAIVRLVVK